MQEKKNGDVTQKSAIFQGNLVNYCHILDSRFLSVQETRTKYIYLDLPRQWGVRCIPYTLVFQKCQFL